MRRPERKTKMGGKYNGKRKGSPTVYLSWVSWSMKYLYRGKVIPRCICHFRLSFPKMSGTDRSTTVLISDRLVVLRRCIFVYHKPGIRNVPFSTSKSGII